MLYFEYFCFKMIEHIFSSTPSAHIFNSTPSIDNNNNNKENF